MLLGFLWEEYGKLTGMGVPLFGVHVISTKLAACKARNSSHSIVSQDLLRIGGLLFGDPVAISDGAGGTMRLPGLGA
jgi:hypothetical protein